MKKKQFVLILLMCFIVVNIFAQVISRDGVTVEIANADRLTALVHNQTSTSKTVVVVGIIGYSVGTGGGSRSNQQEVTVELGPNERKTVAFRDPTPRDSNRVGKPRLGRVRISKVD